MNRLLIVLKADKPALHEAMKMTVEKYGGFIEKIEMYEPNKTPEKTKFGVAHL